MIEIVFISSNRTKFSHIEYGLRDSRYKLSPQKNYGIGYIEPRIYDREKLLKESYEDAKERFSKTVSNAENKFFILEDTSVAIDALSNEDKEVPGLDIKYWMRENTFDTIDKILKERGNRKCTVRSDILLHLPKNLQDKYNQEYIVFVGEQEGLICREESNFDTNALYPWLDNKTFNKWFVPNDYEMQDTPISQLKIEEATKYDFRNHAIKKMIHFLDEEKLFEHRSQKIEYYTPTLFDASIFILVSSTCAGKSTLAEYMADTHGYYHIEASDFMYLEYHKRHGVGSSVAIGDFAQKALEDDPTIVAKQVVEFCRTLASVPIVISGFRTEKETMYFQEKNQKKVQVLFIDTEQDIRYERCKERNRADAVMTSKKFKAKDLQQYDMGIRILEKNVENRISNNSTFDDFYNLLEDGYSQLLKYYPLGRGKKVENMRLEELILVTLCDEVGKFYTTTEISKLINNKFMELEPKNKNNVSRYFNQFFHPYYDIKIDADVNKYALNTTGVSQARFLL